MTSFLCTRCNKVWIDEEYDNHDCTPIMKDYDTFKIAHFYTFTDNLKRSVLRVRTMTGRMLDMVIVPEDKVSTKVLYEPKKLLIEDDETESKFPSSTDKKHDKDYRQGNSTHQRKR
ncbi:MAG: hypothetical protein KGH81_07925 [Thaumarchaeota archaeon]|nr:hypothetical protein [Nitrososphaerota archaeon]